MRELAFYPRLLGTDWTQLEQPVRQAHLVGERLRLVGTFHIRHGTDSAVRPLAALLRLPHAGNNVPTRLDVVGTPTGEKWNNVGGFSDAVFSVVASFLAGDAGRFVAEVEAIEL